MNKKTIKKEDLVLDMTCRMCPEQYDVLVDGEKIAYIRLRGGHLCVNPFHDGDYHFDEIIYSKVWRDDSWKGAFDNETERGSCLDMCKDAIVKYYNEKNGEKPAEDTVSCKTSDVKPVLTAVDIFRNGIIAKNRFVCRFINFEDEVPPYFVVSMQETGTNLDGNNQYEDPSYQHIYFAICNVDKGNVGVKDMWKKYNEKPEDERVLEICYLDKTGAAITTEVYEGVSCHSVKPCALDHNREEAHTYAAIFRYNHSHVKKDNS